MLKVILGSMGAFLVFNNLVISKTAGVIERNGLTFGPRM